MGRNSVNEPSSSGVALRSSTGWFAVVDENGETVTNRLWGSSMRAAEWACGKFGKTWPELHSIGFTVRGGYQSTSGAKHD
jgi:hypothetical protein